MRHAIHPLGLFLAGCCVCSTGFAQEWSTATRPGSPLSPSTDTAAIADRACTEFQDVDVGADAPRPNDESGTASSGSSRDPASKSSAGRVVNPAGQGSRSGTRPTLRRIPFVISLLCQDEITNEQTIASLYLTLQGKSLPEAVSAPKAPSALGAQTKPAPMKDEHDASMAQASKAISALKAQAILVAASDQFIRLRVDNEIESTLREKIWTTTDNARILKQGFSNRLAQVSMGQLPPHQPDERRAQSELSAAYRLLEQRVAGLGVPQALQDLRETQAAWRAYRDAWLGYLAAAAPSVSRADFGAYLARERTEQLRVFYATGDRP
jgi:hypothetical protein